MSLFPPAVTRTYRFDEVFTMKSDTDERLREKARQAYAIWRGNHRGTQPPPHWDYLGDDMQQVAIGMYRMGAAWGKKECTDAQDQ